MKKLVISLTDPIPENARVDTLRTWAKPTKEHAKPGEEEVQKQIVKEMFDWPPAPKKKIRNVFKKPKRMLKFMDSYPLKPNECEKIPDYLKYVKPRKTPSELDDLQKNLEIEAATRHMSKYVVSLDEPKHSFHHEGGIVQVDSPIMEGTVEPEPPSQTPSQILPFIQSRELLDFKAQKSGVVINESKSKVSKKRPSRKRSQEVSLEQFLPPNYDPRALQKALMENREKFLIYKKDGNLYAIPQSMRRTSKRKSRKSSRVSKDIRPKTSKTPFLDLVRERQARKPKPKTAPASLKSIRLTLGFPAGIQLGSFNISDEQFDEKIRSKQSLSCIFAAFAYTKILSEPKWSPQIIDRILILGSDLHKNSLDSEGKLNPMQMKCIQIDDKRVQVNLEPKPLIKGTIRAENGDQKNILEGFQEFFKSEKACLFQCRKVNLLIWKKTGFYVFDPAGRSGDCRPGSFAALLLLKGPENVAHLILNLSNLGDNATYSLTTIKAIRDLSKVNQVPRRSLKKCEKETNREKKAGYIVINAHRAILRSTLHIRNSLFSSARNRQSLANSISALTYSKISPPNTWDCDVLNKIQFLGFELHREWTRGQNDIHLGIKDLPIGFHFGQFGVQIKVDPFYCSGQIDADKEENQLYECVRSTFEHHKRILIQVGRMFFGIWVKNSIYYLYDTYPRDGLGDVCIDEMGECCVQMFSFLEELCKLLRRNMKQIVPHEKFYVHCFEILTLDPYGDDVSLDERPLFRAKPLSSIMELVEMEKDGEIHSLATSVSFDTPRNEEKPQREGDTLLILDSPSASCEDLTDQMAPLSRALRHVASEQSQLSGPPKLRSIKESKVSPSVDYLCSEITHDVLTSVLLQLPMRKGRKSGASSIAGEMRDDMDSDLIAVTSRILLKSDLPQLEQKYKDAKEGRFNFDPNTCSECHPIEGKVLLTLSEELKLPTNYETMPDSSAVIFGTKSIEEVAECLHDDYKMVVLAISAAAVSFKYAISSWNTGTVDFVFETAKKIAEILKKDPTTFFEYVVHHLPTMKLGSKEYSAKMEQIGEGEFANLYNVLENVFPKLGRVVILSPACSLAVFQRKNFYYLFEGFPCNIVGFRYDEGQACVVRFKTLTGLVRRIETNHPEVSKRSRFILSQLQMTQAGDDHYPHMSQKAKEELQKKWECLKKCKEAMQKKQMDEVSKLIREEKKRIRDFMKLKGVQVSESDDLLVDEGPRIVESKSFKPRRSSTTPKEDFQESKPIHLVLPPKPPQPRSGYVQRTEDLQFKIQGSTCLQNRCQSPSSPPQIRACHFASVYAILMAIHHNLPTWNHRKIDICIENGKRLFAKCSNKAVTLNREVEKVLVDNMLYHIAIVSCDTLRRPKKSKLEIQLSSNFRKFRYLLLQFPLCAFAVVKDELYHLFDPYGSQDTCEKTSPVDPEETPIGHTEPDENTASWVLFQTIEDLVMYVEDRVGINAAKDYGFYRVNIVEYKKAPKKSQVSYFLYDSANQEEEETWLCGIGVEDKLRPEEICFLESIKTIPWSRLETSNIVKQKRGMVQSCWKEYDIEAPRELYSLWGNIHPLAPIFSDKTRGKQYMAVSVMACIMAHLYDLDEWSPDLIDSIIVHGDQYFADSIEPIEEKDYEVTLANLATRCTFPPVNVRIAIEMVLCGTLYDDNLTDFNLSRALVYFFQKYNYGVLQIGSRFLTIGREKAYFMFDCQSHGLPLFSPNEGTAYVLRCCSLRRLLECIILTLDIHVHGQEFVLHSVRVRISDRAGGTEEEEIESTPLDEEN